MPIFLTKYCCWILGVLGILTLNMAIISASASEYEFELLNQKDGFASSIIFSIVQDKSGFIWFGTGYDGIMRYDGKNIVRYEHDLRDPYSLPHNNAGNISLDKEDNLWIGSWGGGALRYNQQSQEFSQFLLELEPNRRRSNRVQIIFEDKQGIVWLGSGDNGLYKYNPGSQDFRRLAVN
ncbi:MAG: ligand-binding sensor domain-containing protein, partial [Paraglaciecola sp.]